MNIFEMLAVICIAVGTGTGTTPGDAFKALGVGVVCIILAVVWVKTNPNRQVRRQEMKNRAPAAVAS